MDKNEREKEEENDRRNPETKVCFFYIISRTKEDLEDNLMESGAARRSVLIRQN